MTSTPTVTPFEGPRTAHASRRTSESSIEVALDLDGTGKSEVDTGVGFYDHMLTAFSKHSLVDLRVKATGDLHIDVHHTVEDTAIVIGQCLREALGDKAGIRRYGNASVPLDEALASCVVDVSGRPYFVHTGEPTGFEFHLIGGHFTGSMVSHSLESLTFHAGFTVHLTCVAGRDPHHIAEAEFKAFARAVRQAVEPDPRITDIPSTKGAL
ncbi:imidazoleglycerol-phosphate dehydratase HisB [Brevibacterium litoralis]|uniref:imidazoleglycerol-phosphate dehydratase HisB n=1 Tax=Brevibacterium litoralis TaxID=3138935 RepID=UPI0032EF354A